MCPLLNDFSFKNHGNSFYIRPLVINKLFYFDCICVHMRFQDWVPPSLLLSVSLEVLLIISTLIINPLRVGVRGLNCYTRMCDRFHLVT